MSEITIIQTDKAPAPHGHYVQATVHNNVVYTAIQLGVIPNAEEYTAGTIEEQTRQGLKNIEQILIAAGSGFDKLLKMTIFLADIKLWDMVNDIYAEVTQEHKAARSVIHCNHLHFDFTVGFEAIAAI